jgi:ATP-binding cassette subfamily C protein
VLSACLECANRGNPAQASQAYRDLTVLRQFVESNACPMLFDALWVPLFLSVLFLVHPLLGVIGAGSVLFLFGLALVGDVLTEDAQARSGTAWSRSHSRFATAVDNVQLIRATGMRDRAARLICQAAQDARSEHDVAQRRYEIIMLVAKPARALAQVLIMGAAAWLVLDYNRSPAIIFASTLLFSRALAPVEGAIAGWKAFATALSAYRRLTDVLVVIPVVPENTGIASNRGRLIVDNVGVELPGSGKFLLREVSFSLAPGECLGIIGPSGSGKSMLGQIIAGISTPTEGRVLLDNVDVAVLREGGGGRHLGYLPQDINLFGETIKDVIAGLDDSDPQKIIAAAKLAGIHDTIVRLPQGYDTVIPSGGCAFSRGYRQRLGLARAFFDDPRLVVLDEPNASLDYVGERLLFDAIEQLKKASITVIIITHRMGILAATNRIAIMQGGAVTACGESEEIFERYLSRPQVASQVTLPDSAPAAANVSPKRVVP